MSYDTLCLSSGGVNGFQLCGAIKYFVDKKILKMENINTFIGTSVGSMIILPLSVGHDIDSIINIIYGLNFKKLDIDFNF